MHRQNINYRTGIEDDIPSITKYLDIAGHGYLSALEKSGLIPKPWQDYILKEIMDPNSSKFYENVCIADYEGEVVGILTGFRQEPIPDIQSLNLKHEYEKNLVELAQMVSGSFYMANVAVAEEFRGHGIGSYFTNLSFIVAKQMGCDQIFGIIHESNIDWLNSFIRRGFKEIARKSVANFPSLPAESFWVLLTAKVE